VVITCISPGASRTPNKKTSCCSDDRGEAASLLPLAHNVEHVKYIDLGQVWACLKYDFQKGASSGEISASTLYEFPAPESTFQTAS